MVGLKNSHRFIDLSMKSIENEALPLSECQSPPDLEDFSQFDSFHMCQIT